MIAPPGPAFRWPRARALALALALALTLVLDGCALVELRQQADEFYASTVLVGRVTLSARSDPGSGPIVVVARSLDATAGDAAGAVAAQTLLHEAGGFELIVPHGRYRLQAFGDRNGNLRLDPGEPVARYRGERAVVASGGFVGALDMALGDERDGDDLPVGFAVASGPSGRHSTQAGALADLDSPLFGAERGRQGYWEPMRFFRELGGNVYFLEPYDARKIPVLFVHGAAGSPQDWRRFIAQLDRRRYQPWIFYYPSGAPVESMSHLLYWKLFNLHLKHGFEQLVITAHSMGGLVARSFLVNQGAQFPIPKLFVSISTPWGGEPAAETGVRHSPAIVPSWRDMLPDGRFVRELFLHRLPPRTEYVLLFGHKGGYSLARPNTDGTVTLASQLKSPAQDEARRVFGFDEDHTSILSAPDVLARYAAVLDDPAWRGAGAGTQETGVLRLHLDATMGTASAPGPRPIPLLVLDRLDGAAQRLTFALGPDDTTREIASLPVGRYQLTVVTDAFRSEPARARVTIQAGEPAQARFAFVPQGTLIGYVGRRVEAVDRPAGSFVPPDEKVRIRSIALTGAGVRRTLVPRRDGPEDSFAHYADGKDDAYGPYFLFVGLPEGDYDLVIEAEGFGTYRGRHVVVPGRHGPMRPVLLTPLAGDLSTLPR